MGENLSSSTTNVSGDKGLSLAVAIANITNRVIMGIVSLVVCGLVMRILWGWFVVPVFKISMLTLPQTIGLVLIVAFLRGGNFQDRHELETNMQKMIKDDLLAMGEPLIVLVLGYIVHLCTIV